VSTSFDIGAIDDVIHGRLRLGVMAYLSGAHVAEFNELKAKLETTDGNLSVHLRKLEEAGYIGIEKTYAGRKPLTRVKLTDKGRGAFVTYLDAIGNLVNDSNRNNERKSS
jgi:DNA-binding HxlR family transcriptional regulator